MLDVAKGELDRRLDSSVRQADSATIEWHGWSFPYEAVSCVCMLLDGLIIVSLSFLSGILYQAISTSVIVNFDSLLGSGLLAALLYVLIAHSVGLYRFTAIALPQKVYLRLLNCWLLVSLSLTLLAFLFKIGASFSRGSFISFLFLTPASLLLCRWAVTQVLSQAIKNGRVQGRRIILLGTREELAALDAERLLPGFGLSEIDRIVLPNQHRSSFSLTGGEQNALDWVVDSARSKAADEIVLALSWSDSRLLELVRDWMRSSPLPVRLLPDRVVRSLSENPAFRLRPSLSIELQRGPLSRLEQVGKRIFDFLGASVALLVFLPIMIITAVAIKLDSPGPIFFRQRRSGFNTKQFFIFKFRTMTVCEDGQNVVQAKRYDKRITRTGRFLRESSIDELPQLLNVLKGDMSLVGPRPHALAHDSQYGSLVSEYAFRHHVKPGITGWAQANGYRGETPLVEQMQRRVELDLWYINNWSLMLDFKILLKTCLEVMRKRNAH